MGDRLVCVISKDKKILAASYQHWEAGAYPIMREIVNNNIAEWKNKINCESETVVLGWKNEINQEAAVKILIKSLHEYNRNKNPIVLELDHYNWSKDDGVEFSSEEEKKFAALHPEIISDWDKANRSDGLICINEEKIDDWRQWAEREEWFEV